MPVFTLEELKQLPQDKIFLASVDYQSDKDDALFQREWQEILEEEEKYKNLWPHRQEDLHAFYGKRKKELLCYGNIISTILYIDGSRKIDLLENEALKEEDIVLEKTLCPIEIYLNGTPLEYGIAYQASPFECFARINDRRFSYFDNQSQSCYDGPLLNQYATLVCMPLREKLYQGEEDLGLAIAMQEESDTLKTTQIMRHLSYEKPYFGQNELNQLDWKKMAVAVINYQDSESVLPLERQMEANRQIEQACQESEAQVLKYQEFFRTYKRKREKSEEKTNRMEFERRRNWYLKSQENLLLSLAERANYLKCSHMASTLLYRTSEGLIDLYANQKLEKTKASVVEETYQPLSHYCDGESIHLEIKRSPTEEGYYMVLEQPIITVHTASSSYQDTLLNVVASLYYHGEYTKEIKHLQKEKVKKR